MLPLHIPETEFYNEETNEFITIKEQTLKLEHSLISISKWEEKYCKPFISKDKKTLEETLYYIKCMTIGNVDDRVYLCITDEMIEKINEYIENPRTATKFFDLRTGKDSGGKRYSTITSEEIYCSMVMGNIPESFSKWHISRLIALIRLVGMKSDPKAQKMNRKEHGIWQHELNKARRKKWNTKG